MKVIDLMTRKPKVIGPDDTLQAAARVMEKENAGVLPVVSGSKLIGMLTDRDITTRATAHGDVPAMKVRGAMTNKAITTFEDEDVQSAGRKMLSHKVGRLPVLDRNLKLAGIVSLADIIASQGGKRLIKGSVLAGMFRVRYLVPVLVGAAVAGFYAAHRARVKTQAKTRVPRRRASASRAKNSAA